MSQLSRILAGILLASSLLAGSRVQAATSESYEEALSLINQRKSCTELSQAQLEQIGDYYMEQMMPGQAHVNMDQIMGGEGSESLRQMHILMARPWYCGDAVGLGMMGMMGGFGTSFRGTGMMNFGQGISGFYSPYSMMGGGFGWGWMILFPLAGLVLLAVLIAVAVKYLLKK